MSWLKDRLKEKDPHGGLGLVAVGLIILFLGSWINIVAYAPDCLGAWQFLQEVNYEI